jgi:DNA-directed RNA polymerase I, II, and III subunit RPABC2
MSDDGYDGGPGGGDDYDYGGPSFGEDTFVCPFYLLSCSHSRDIG